MWINSYSFVVGNLSERGFDAGFRREKVGAGRKEYDIRSSEKERAFFAFLALLCNLRTVLIRLFAYSGRIKVLWR